VSKEVVFDVRRIAKELDELEPGLKKQMVREFKTIARPMANDISKEVRSIAPLSGMTEHSGRTNWENGKYKNTAMRSDNVLIRYRQNRSRRSKVTSLVSIWLRSPMPAIVGVAGKGSGIARSTQTKTYAWKGQTRSHKLNGQGRALIGQVRSRGWFNFFYKSAESKMPDTEREVKLIWEKYSSKVSRRL
jgi:hypothetical protein